MAPKEITRVQVNSIEIVVSDSLKQAFAAGYASSLMNSPVAMSANVFSSAAANLAGSTCGTGSAPSYTLSRVAFTPEAIPTIAPFPVYDDGVIPASEIPIGFSFSFYGQRYEGVNVFSNGFLTFGALPSPLPRDGYATAGFIPWTANPNNMIAFAWTDWQPDMVSDPIRYETRGAAPNRRFIIQFNNVPEYNSANRFNDIKTLGGLMTQIVLHEGSNNITIYTNKLKVVNSGHLVTQGIENEAGTEAVVDSTQNAVNGSWNPRIRIFFNLTNDAIRFSPPSTVDDEAPAITAPANISGFPNDPGLGSAVVGALGSPATSDNCTEVTVTSARSDGKEMDAPYPVGVTTITWTAKDAAGNTATATQSIEVIDVEAPVITFLPANFAVNATSSIGAMVSYVFTATDNVGVTSLVCDPALGSRLPIGPNPVTCSAFDAAGHKTSGSFEVNVIDAPTQMQNLIEYVISRGMGNGTTNPLVNELQQAFGNVGTEHGCKKMSDFMEMVIKKGVPDNWASYMFSEAQRIMTVMKCQTTTIQSKKARPRLMGG